MMHFCLRGADDVLFELAVTKTWLRQVIVALPLICHSSYRGVVEFMRDLLGISISLGTVHNELQAATRNAVIVNDAEDLSSVRVGLHDEIFQGKTPVLAGVDAASAYCYLLVAAEHRDADTWGMHLLDATKRGLKPDHPIADAGQGLPAGQKAAWDDTPCHGDVFHIQHQYEGLANAVTTRPGCDNASQEVGDQDRSRQPARPGWACHSIGTGAADRGSGLPAGSRRANAHAVVVAATFWRWPVRSWRHAKCCSISSSRNWRDASPKMNGAFARCASRCRTNATICSPSPVFLTTNDCRRASAGAFRFACWEACVLHRLPTTSTAYWPG